MSGLLRDLRYAARSLRAKPGLAAAALVTLALGIGATTAVFSVVDGVLLRPLPYPEPGRLVRIWSAWEGSPRSGVSPAEYFDYREDLAGFAGVAAFAGGRVNVGGDEVPEQVQAAYVSASLFPTLGVPPALGRTFSAVEDRPAGERVVVLADALWRTRFGGSPGVMGRRVWIDGEPRTVIGVMPPGFRLPEDFGSADPARLYLPLGLDRASVPNRGSHFLAVVGRLGPGAGLERGRAALNRLTARFRGEFPDDYPPGMGFRAEAEPLAEAVVGPVRPQLLLLLAAVGLVLAIACANVASILIAHAEERRREIAVRGALGAGRAAIVRQLLAESLLLAGLGGALGVALAVFGVDALVALRPPDLPRLDEVGVDLRVLGFALLASCATGLAFGLAPALGASHPDLERELRQGGRGATVGGRGWLRRGVVVAEIALALILLAGAGLLGKSLLLLERVDPGFRTERVLTVRVTLPESSYPDAAGRTRFYRELVGRAGAVPGALAAGAVTALPLTGPRGDLNIHIEGRDEPAGERSPAADWQVVTPGYFEAIGMRVVRGRGIAGSDDERAPGAVVINETMARLLWPGEDPLGRRFTLGGGAGPGLVTVVGIVNDVRHAGLAVPPRPEMYLPHAQFRLWDSGDAIDTMSLVVRTAGDPEALAAALAREVREIDPDLPLSSFRTMEQVVSDSLARPRFTALLLAIFSAVALALAAVGVYGVLVQAAARRTREVGLRMALGARPADVLRTLLAETLALAGTGVAAGLAGALLLTRILRAQLYGVSPTDPSTLAATAAAMLAVALAATWRPARSALRVDPAVALRSE